MNRLTTFRKCFGCGAKYPLLMYYKESPKHQVTYYQNHSVCCRFCVSSKIFTGKIVTLKNNKHIVAEVEPNLLNAIKQFFGIPLNHKTK